MNHRRLAAFTAATLAAAALGVSITAAASPARNPQARAAAATARKVVVDCVNKKQIEPRSIVLACADGNAYLDRMAWTSWTPQLASATANLVENDCNPTCVGGHFHSYPGLVMLWGNAAFKGSQRFTELTVVFPGSRPPIFNGHRWVRGPQTFTYDLFARP